MNRHALLINPPIMDFAAFDFWIRPVGLLKIAAILRTCGWSVSLIDSMDRFHPLLENRDNHRSDGRGKFYRQIISKPDVLSHIPRFFSRYGLPKELFQKALSNVEKPDLIFVTSMMTYWYPAVQDVINDCRQAFQVPILLGGVYASLCTRHAMDHCQPDVVITGEGEQKLLLWLEEQGFITKDHKSSLDIDNLPYPAYDLYDDLPHVAVMTSRGCPMRCSFCASHLLCQGYRRTKADKVVDQIIYWAENRQTRHFAFYDDALLLDNASSFKKILKTIIERNLELQLHLPNGIHPRHIDQELATLMFSARVKTIRLSFETINHQRQRDMSSKVDEHDLVQAISTLGKAGYGSDEIGVYVLMGLPDQSFDEVRDSVEFVRRTGATVHIASFSPIPGTKEWMKAIKHKLWDPDSDLLLTNNSIFPIWSKQVGYNACQDFLYSIKSQQ